jgi:hypothetical protein
VTTTETRPPGALATARRDRDRAQGRLDRLRLALDEAERGGATVVRIDAVRAIVQTERGGES